MSIALQLLAPLALAAPVAAAQSPPAPSFPEATLTAPAPTPSDFLGDSALVASVDWIGAGVPDRTGGGIALVWDRALGAAAAPEALVSPQPTVGGKFGTSLDLDGDSLAVGERRSSAQGNRGAVHLYQRSAGSWSLSATVTNPATFASSGFGWSVSLDGDTLAVGVPFAFVGGTARGAVDVFRRSGGTWSLEATLTASDGMTLDEFGKSVALSGDRIIVGAARRSPSGQAYAFERSGGTWTETARFDVTPGSGDLGFGIDVDIEGSIAVVGAQRNNVQGAVYAYEHGPSGWSLAQRIQPDGLAPLANFGIAVDLAGDRIAVGAVSDDAAGFASGSSWEFERAGGVWAPRARLVQPLGASAGLFGDNVATDGAGTIVTAAPRNTDETGVGFAGALFLHNPDAELGAGFCSAALNSSGRAGGITARGSAVAAANDVRLVAFDLPASQFGFFLVARDAGFVPQPGGSEGDLCLGGLIGRFVGAGQIQNSGVGRQFALDVDLGAIPRPSAFEATVPGDTWRFQAWYRDRVQGQPTSNFTGGRAVTFQ